MSALARWASADPLGEKHPEWTPYNYVLNNTPALVDPDGKQVPANRRVEPAQAGPLAPGGGFVRGPVRPGMFAGVASRAITEPLVNGPLTVGTSSTVGNITCGTGTGGSGCGISLNSPSRGMSVDLGYRFRDAGKDPASGSVSIGVGKHMGATITNGQFVVNIGLSTPTVLPFTVTVDIPATGAQPAPSIVQQPDATVVTVVKLVEPREIKVPEPPKIHKPVVTVW